MRWLVLIFVLCLLFLSWFAIIFFTAPNIETYISKNNVSLTQLDDLVNTADNGDLIFLAGDTFSERSIRRYHGSFYSHCCIIFRDKDESVEGKGEIVPYVFESDMGQGYRDGPRVMRLTDKLSRWKGLKYGLWKRYSPLKDRPSSEDIRRVAQNFLKYNFDKSMVSWIFSGYPESALFLYFKPPKTLFCSELVALALQNLGIIEKDHSPTWYTPENFASGKGVVLKRGSYNEARYFKMPTKPKKSK